MAESGRYAKLASWRKPDIPVIGEKRTSPPSAEGRFAKLAVGPEADIDRTARKRTS